ncbi:MAG: bifunctional D-glycero-beta-D-manno-heptose-7-phosphate kinase/D-glycero-beta-D-manno-heptose 1-phosphate adenylyltransferase HldE [Gammaproteobacteria bacterium]|nr:bifunctional D-glycero-beta-D-manno-heptose-7-phosphate kinase/D-glycero-beta-D-manno-heptose 1-phosphate adenylyltransferase HldE [Gammaproteobacteria bacterium]
MTLKIPNFSKSRLLVVGDLMLDRYWHGGARRISPEAPVPVVGIDKIEERPGGAANVAYNLSALGCGVTLQGVVGKDEAADRLEHLLNNVNVNCRFLVQSDVPTITKLRVISQHQQLIRLDFEEILSSILVEEINESFAALVRSHELVLFSDYGKGVLQDVQTLIKIANQHNKPVVIDPKGSDFSKYKNSTLMTPNAKEFEAVVGECKSDEAVETRGRNLLDELNLKALLVTRGEHGMSLMQRDDSVLHITTDAKEVYDVTGAGDTVISVFSAALARGLPLKECARLANVAAGIAVGKLGTATVTTSELRSALKGKQSHEQGIMSEDDLLAAVADAKVQKKKIVMTNGCFDLLHAGHIAYLEQARLLGDKLIVAVNSDDSVKRLKGNSRPIIPLEQRMAVLSGLSSVDWVVPFSEDTPERLMRAVLPDILVKGGDYQVEDIAGYGCVTENGGVVEVLQFLNGCSTSKIVEKIKSL